MLVKVINLIVIICSVAYTSLSYTNNSLSALESLPTDIMISILLDVIKKEVTPWHAVSTVKNFMLCSKIVTKIAYSKSIIETFIKHIYQQHGIKDDRLWGCSSCPDLGSFKLMNLAIAFHTPGACAWLKEYLIQNPTLTPLLYTRLEQLLISNQKAKQTKQIDSTHKYALQFLINAGVHNHFIPDKLLNCTLADLTSIDQ